MSRISRTMVLICFWGGLSNASAGLVSQDLYSTGDGLVTLDTQTNFEWLDLSQSRLSQDSFNGVAGSSLRGLGFHLAYLSTTERFMTDAGMQNWGASGWNSAQAASQFGSLVGWTYSSVGWTGYTYYATGLAKSDTYSGTNLGRVSVYYLDAGLSSQGAVFLDNDAEIARGFYPSSSNRESLWLYRDMSAVAAVPEPETIAQFGAGLLVLGAVFARQWKKRTSEGRLVA